MEVISGATLSIVPLRHRSFALSGHCRRRCGSSWIRATGTRQPPTGYHLYVLNGRFIIHGGSVEGTQFGVYGWLDEHLGCRWLTRDFESIPAIPTIQSPLLSNEVQEPSIRDRYRIGQGSYSYADPDWARRNRVGVVVTGSDESQHVSMAAAKRVFRCPSGLVSFDRRRASGSTTIRTSA